MGEVRYRTEASSLSSKADKTHSVVTEGSVTPPRPAAARPLDGWASAPSLPPWGIDECRVGVGTMQMQSSNQPGLWLSRDAPPPPETGQTLVDESGPLLSPLCHGYSCIRAPADASEQTIAKHPTPA